MAPILSSQTGYDTFIHSVFGGVKVLEWNWFRDRYIPPLMWLARRSCTASTAASLAVTVRALTRKGFLFDDMINVTLHAL